jgi:hypothetical protein
MNASEMPRMALVRQKFPEATPIDIPATLERELARLRSRITPGASIAVGVGSRGISNLEAIVRAVLAFLEGAKAIPFIVPAMGSHGGATPEGQLELLAEYGITEARLGVPIRAAVEAERIGVTSDGLDVFFSQEALRADGVIVINRIKPHTDFQSDTLGSGLLKMLVVGLGKRPGAANFHTSASRFGYEHVIRTSSQITLAKAPILGGVGILENQRHDTAQLAVLLPEEIERRETELYAEAKRLMPRLPFDDIDLLIIDRIGKNISGSGMDPNVTGRGIHGYSSLLGDRSTNPVVRRIFVRDLTPETHGNAVGIGLADFTTSRLVRATNQSITTLNALTALSVQSVKIPIHFETDREAVTRALESLALRDVGEARVMRIHDTLSLEKIAVSEGFFTLAAKRSDLELLAEPRGMDFDPSSNLAPL